MASIRGFPQSPWAYAWIWGNCDPREDLCISALSAGRTSDEGILDRSDENILRLHALREQALPNRLKSPRQKMTQARKQELLIQQPPNPFGIQRTGVRTYPRRNPKGIMPRSLGLVPGVLSSCHGGRSSLPSESGSKLTALQTLRGHDGALVVAKRLECGELAPALDFASGRSQAMAGRIRLGFKSDGINEQIALLRDAHKMSKLQVPLLPLREEREKRRTTFGIHRAPAGHDGWLASVDGRMVNRSLDEPEKSLAVDLPGSLLAWR